MNSYADFADVYDRLMDDFDYPAWAQYYMKLIAPANARRICDCACGTGSLTLEYAARGLEVTGADLSGEMLRIAAEKARRRGMNVKWICMDMSRLVLPSPVDAILCGCDGVNYLTSLKQVRAFFDAAFAQIRPGGMLAFDISSEYKLREVLGDAFYGEERDDVAYLWQNSMRGDVVNMNLIFFVRQSDGLYRRFSETHRQRAHSVDELREQLQAAGFTDIRVFGDMTFEVPKADEMRIHFTAVRP